MNRSKTVNAGRGKRDLNKHDNGIIYLAQLSNKNENFIKVGITAGDGLSHRFGNTHRGYRVSKIIEHKLSIKDACLIEQKILEVTHICQQLGLVDNTECFDIEIKDTILKQINRSIP